MMVGKIGCTIAVFACVIVATTAGALARKHQSPKGADHISIRVSENPVIAGDQLAIFGRLTGPVIAQPHLQALVEGG